MKFWSGGLVGMLVRVGTEEEGAHREVRRKVGQDFGNCGISPGASSSRFSGRCGPVMAEGISTAQGTGLILGIGLDFSVLEGDLRDPVPTRGMLSYP